MDPRQKMSKDAERLNWIEQMIREGGAVWFLPSGDLHRFVQIRKPGAGCSSHPVANNLRAAIDAAMTASQDENEEL